MIEFGYTTIHLATRHFIPGFISVRFKGTQKGIININKNFKS